MRKKRRLGIVLLLLCLIGILNFKIDTHAATSDIIVSFSLKDGATLPEYKDNKGNYLFKMKAVPVVKNNVIYILVDQLPPASNYDTGEVTCDVFNITFEDGTVTETTKCRWRQLKTIRQRFFYWADGGPSKNEVQFVTELPSDYDKEYPSITELSIDAQGFKAGTWAGDSYQPVSISYSLENYDLTSDELAKTEVQAGVIRITLPNDAIYNCARILGTNWNALIGIPDNSEIYANATLDEKGTTLKWENGTSPTLTLSAQKKDGTTQKFIYPIQIVSDRYIVPGNNGIYLSTGSTDTDIDAVQNYNIEVDETNHVITWRVKSASSYYKDWVENLTYTPFYALGASGQNTENGSFTVDNLYKGTSFTVKNGKGETQTYRIEVAEAPMNLRVATSDSYQVKTLDDGAEISMHKVLGEPMVENLYVMTGSRVEVQITPPEGKVLGTADVKDESGNPISFEKEGNTLAFTMAKGHAKALVDNIQFVDDTDTRYQITYHAKLEDGTEFNSGYATIRKNGISVSEALENDQVELTAEAREHIYYGYEFVRWDYDDGLTATTEDNKLTLTMPGKAVEITGVYKKTGTPVTLGVEPASAAGKLNVTTEGGEIVNTSEQAYTDTYKTGIALTLKLQDVESRSYVFKGWKLNGTMLNPADTVDGIVWNQGQATAKDGSTIDYQYPTITLSSEATELKAVFATKPNGFVKVSSSDETMGTVSAKVGDETITDETLVYQDMEVTLTATPKKGHLFENWEVVTEDSGITLAEPKAETTTFTMPDNNKDVEIRANFAEDPTWENDECNLTGAYMQDGEGKVIKEADRSGTTFTFTFTKEDLTPEEAGKLDLGGYYLKLDVSKGASVKCGAYDDKNENGKYSEGTVANTIGKNSSEEITVTSQDGNNQKKYTIKVVYDTTPLVRLVSAERTSDTEAKVSFKSDTSGTYYYMYKKSTESDPKKEDVLSSSVSGSISAGNEKVLNIKSLKAEEAYRVYIVVKGSDGAVSDMLTAELPTLGAYAVKLSYPQSGGTLSVDKSRADEGETITVTVTPKDGKKLDTLNYSSSDSAAGKVEITEKSGKNTYTFTMPGYNISIGCTWADATEEDGPSITGFVVNGVNGVINQSAGTISITLPYGTDLTSLKPEITFKNAKSVSPASGAAVNLTAPVTYTVTAEDGTTKTYTVTATVAAQSNSDKLWEDMLKQTGGSTDHTGKNTWWQKAKDMKKNNNYPKYW